MSEPIWLGPRSPSQAEWREMQEIVGSSLGNYHTLEERVEGMVADIVKRPFAIAFGSTGSAIEAALDGLCGRAP
jgi:dTDP-4-amino-4,6-dideoxygalactose transaminase